MKYKKGCHRKYYQSKMSNETNDFLKLILLNTNNQNFMIKTSTTNYNASDINETEFTQNGLNVSTNAQINDSEELSKIIDAVISVIYVIIFISGVLGNVITCVVISRNRSMHTGNIVVFLIEVDVNIGVPSFRIFKIVKICFCVRVYENS